MDFSAKSAISHVVRNGLLFLAVGLYVLGGVYLFQYLEMDLVDQNLKSYAAKSKQIEKSRLSMPAQIVAAVAGGNKSNDYLSRMTQDLINAYHMDVADAIANFQYEGVPVEETSFKNGWSFTSALLFTITIVTTIGYGHVTPKTSYGYLTTIAYALIGVPLMLMFMANIGDLMADVFRMFYGRLCCYVCRKKRKLNYEFNRRRITDLQQSRLAHSAWTTRSARDSVVEKQMKLAEDSGMLRDESKNTSAALFATGTEIGTATVPEVTARKRVVRSAATLDGFKTSEEWEKEFNALAPLPCDPYEVIKDPDDNAAINVPISLTMVVIAAYLFLGAVLFSIWNDWSWVTGAYFSFVTLATIGFGDLVPGWDNAGSSGSGAAKMFCSVVYIAVGLACISMSFNLMMEEMIAKFSWLGRKLGIVDDDHLHPARAKARFAKKSDVSHAASGGGSGGHWQAFDDDRYYLFDKGTPTTVPAPEPGPGP